LLTRSRLLVTYPHVPDLDYFRLADRPEMCWEQSISREIPNPWPGKQF